MNNRVTLIDIVLIGALVVLSVITIGSLAVEHASRWVQLAGLAGIIAVALSLVFARFATRPDHVRALQSHMILEVANAAISYLRQGLNPESAQAVCRIVLAETEAAAVAITDADTVLGFAGIGEDHHEAGGPIITRATRESIEHNEPRVLSTKDEIGCPRTDCKLTAAIVVPLEMRGQAVGTLKFYYTTPRLLNETQIAMAEGLAQVLSTQLELAELERQTELATRMELKALQAQINPHFLFNTINTIAALIRTDPARARELLREFAAFYRRTLESGDDLIPLALELEQTHRYLSFELARFGDRVVVKEDIDPGILQVLVPAFIVQPLVENAVAHGMRPDAPLTVSLTSSVCDDGSICVSVSDDGVGIPAQRLPHVLEAGSAKGLGIALKNVDDRLKGHFGPGSGVIVESVEGSGTTVSLVLAGVSRRRVKEGARMLKALVVDDEAPARSELRYLLGEAGGVEVVGEASNTIEALQLIKAIPYDVIFLDINMPGLSGVQLAEVLAGLSRPPAIIFVTAHGEHAVKAFEVNATDYLVKPVELDRLKNAITRLTPAAEATPARVERIPVEKAGKKLLISVDDILYVMAKDDYSYLYTAADRYLSTISLAQLEAKLETAGFFRIHRRYLVNLARVKEVVPMYGGTLLLTLVDDAATQIPVSRRRVPALKKALGL